nr:immunoglobulin light chain junction region [Macaca mulatta]
CQQGDTYPPTF